MIMRTITGLMAISARTVSEAAGHDFVTAEVIEGAGLRRLGQAMIYYGKHTGKANFERAVLSGFRPGL